MILTLVMIDQLQLRFSGLKQVLHDQTRQNVYQAVQFNVYIHNLMFVFLLIKCSETSHGVIVILPLDRPVTTNINFSGLKQVVHDQTRYQTVPFSVYIHNLMFSIVVIVVSPLLKHFDL